MSAHVLHEALGRALAASPGVVSAYLFGSAAAGREHRESDVDLGVLLNRQLLPHAADRFEMRLRLGGQLQGIAGREVDVVILNDAPPRLVRRTMTKGGSSSWRMPSPITPTSARCCRAPPTSNRFSDGPAR